MRQELHLKLPPRRTPLPLLPGAVRRTPCRLFLARTSWRLAIQPACTAFTGRQPFAAAPSFAVAGWQPGTLPQSSNIIVDSLQERLESGGRAHWQSLVCSPRCRADDHAVVEYFALCFRN